MYGNSPLAGSTIGGNLGLITQNEEELEAMKFSYTLQNIIDRIKTRLMLYVGASQLTDDDYKNMAEQVLTIMNKRMNDSNSEIYSVDAFSSAEQMIVPSGLLTDTIENLQLDAGDRTVAFNVTFGQPPVVIVVASDINQSPVDISTAFNITTTSFDVHIIQDVTLVTYLAIGVA